MGKFNMKLSGANLLACAEKLEYIKDWRKIRAILSAVACNSEDLNSKEREILLSSCYDMLFYPFTAIRLQACESAAKILVHAGDDLPELWKNMLQKILFPERNMDIQQNRWMCFSLKQIISCSLKEMDEKSRRIFLHTYTLYFKYTGWTTITCVNLLSGLIEVPSFMLSVLQKHEIFGFIRQFLSLEDEDIKTLSLLVLRLWFDQGWNPLEDEQQYLNDYKMNEFTPFVLQYLMFNLKTNDEKPRIGQKSIFDLIRNDLISDEEWTVIYTNLYILKDCIYNLSLDRYTLKNLRKEFAAYLQNLLRLNNHPLIFMHAGEILLDLLPSLDDQQKYEIFQDSLKSIEMGTYFSNYIPSFLGRGFFCLNEEQQKICVDSLVNLSDSVSVETASDVIETACLIYHCSGPVMDVIPDSAKLARIISRGLRDYRDFVVRETVFLVAYYLADIDIRDYELNRFLKSEIKNTASETPQKIAFFCETFDPFTTRDRAIINFLKSMGFTVCLSLNEFSTDVNPQPSKIRRRILSLSTAGMDDVFILPEDISINTHNDKDLEKLRALYRDSEIYIVSDETAISALEGRTESSWPHIIYSNYDMQGIINRDAIKKVINADVIFVQLPENYRNISASEIQRRVFSGKDITGMVDRRVKHMIGEWRIYLDRPVYRKEAPTQKIRREFSENQISIYIGDSKGHLTYTTSGKTAVITEISGACSGNFVLSKLVLVEFIAFCINMDFSHIVCFDADKYRDLMIPFGFEPMKDYENGLTIDLSSSVVLFFDADSFIKAPYKNDPLVIRQIRAVQDNLQLTLSRIFSGKPILSFYSDILSYQLIQMIKKDRNISDNSLCVPFGKILKGVNVPGVTIKELNIEKVYAQDISGFYISEMPEYPSINAQMETLKSFDMPLVLVDDLFHKGYRFENINILFKEKDLAVSKMISGVLSGAGKKLAKKKDLTVESVYYVPNMKLWLLESDLYPFIGGDGIESYKNEFSHGGALASINTILPYQMPSFFKNLTAQSVYKLSKTSVENAYSLVKVLEEVYHRINNKPLTMERIGEVMAEPRYPSEIFPEAHKSDKISLLLEEELEKLRRLRFLL